MPASTLLRRVACHGSGPPLVLVHGETGPGIWDLLVEPLATRFQVLVPVLPGFWPRDGRVRFSDQMFVDYLELLRIVMGFECWSMAGYSLGGRFALNYALQHSENTTKLVLGNITGLSNITPLLAIPGLKGAAPPLMAKMLDNSTLGAKLVERDFSRRDHPMIPAAGAYFGTLMSKATGRENYSRIFAGGGTKAKGWPTVLPGLKVPTQVLWSAEDRTCPVQGAYILKKLLPISELRIVEGLGHMAIYEVPEFYTFSMLRFL